MDVKPGEVNVALRVFCDIAKKKARDKDAIKHDRVAVFWTFMPFLISILDHLYVADL